MKPPGQLLRVSVVSLLLVLGLRFASSEASVVVEDDFSDAVMENGVLKSEIDYGPATATSDHTLSVGTLDDEALHLGDGSGSIYITAKLPRAVSLANVGDFVEMTFDFTTEGGNNGNRVLRYGLFQGADDDADATGYFLAGYNQGDGPGSDMNSQIGVDLEVGTNHFFATSRAPDGSPRGSNVTLSDYPNQATLRIERFSEDIIHISGVHGPRDMGTHIHIMTDDSVTELDEIRFGIHDRPTNFTIDNLTVISGTADAELPADMEADQSSPEATVRSVVEAIRDGHDATAASCIHGDEQAKQFILDMADYAGEIIGLRSAVKEQWGAEAWARFEDPYADASAIDGELDKLSEVEFAIEGDRASGGDYELVRLDGKWYLDATADGGDLPLAEAAEYGFAMYSRMIKASRVAEVYRRKRNRIGGEDVTAESLSNEVGQAITDTIAEMSAPEDYTYDVSEDDQTATITGYRGPGGDIVIPSELNGRTVTRIARRGLYDNRNITRVVIPDTVTHIGREGLRDGRMLNTIFLSGSVTNISRPAFNRCHELMYIHVAEDNPEFSSIDGVLFNKDQTAIRRYPIARAGDYTIPDTVTTIINEAFRFCRGLTDITIPDGVTFIGHSAFRGCSSLTEISIPEGVTTIKRRAFKDCIGLSSITIPDGVTTINRRTFRGCLNLETVTLPANLTEIREQAFYDCGSLTSITIPAGVTQLGCGRGGEVFKGCDKLSSIVFLGDAPSLVSEEDMFPSSELTIYRLESAEGWPEPGSDWMGLPTALFTPDDDAR